MGASIPSEPRWSEDAAPAEKILWRWAIDQLDDRILVLPQVAMTVPAKGRPDEAELDLVLLDPDCGITVVEVKGGTISYDGRHARWLQNGKEANRDPVQQAKRNRSILRRSLRNIGVDADKVALRWAVATPECRLEAPGEPVLDASLLWDTLAADQLELLYARTCGSLTLGEEPLGNELTEHLSNYLRGRTREGRAALSTEVDEHEEQVRIHTESHRNVLAQFTHNKHVLVTGAAGTGKTVLALEAAVRFASQGDRVLVLCWNIVLASWMRAQLRAELRRLGSPVADQVTEEAGGQVVVSHAVGLARQAVDELPELAESELYHEWLPERLDLATTQGEFDVVILDEAQDLSDMWVLCIAQFVKKGGRWIAFSDRQQDLFHNEAELPQFIELSHELRENFRNSKQIAEFAARFGEIEMDCVTGDGPPVRYVACPSDRVVGRTDEIAKKLQRDERIEAEDLAVLWLFHNPNQGKSDELAERALEGEMVRTNSASFKGMERPVVVLGLDMDPEKSDRADEVARAIYTATTRARSHLVVVGDPDVAATYGFEELASELSVATAAKGGHA